MYKISCRDDGFHWLLLLLLLLLIAANRRRKVQQRRSSTRSNRKHTMVPLAAAIRSTCDLGAQLTASWNRLYAGFCRGRKTGEPGEKPSKQGREPTQTQPTYGIWSENRTSATLVGGECSHRCAIPASLFAHTTMQRREMTSTISSLVKIWKIRHSGLGCSFVWILWVVYFPLKHSRLYTL